MSKIIVAQKDAENATYWQNHLQYSITHYLSLGGSRANIDTLAGTAYAKMQAVDELIRDQLRKIRAIRIPSSQFNVCQCNGVQPCRHCDGGETNSNQPIPF